eukprot:TRINITY_DN22495_c0_g1_i2.p1 TRINITY_DN22495_c0_g1~~TRINITY_DN22495_c0_g1_i2.p1  ORF type:complete len:289 (+),score=48.53 TRINITY_DN22495_c0_g1_i2:116-982(+)
MCIRDRFKDFLIYDDISEFLKRFYFSHETATRLQKIYDYYDKYSKVFPNYVVLKESRFMFKNIERKQRLIDEHQKIGVDIKKKKTQKLKSVCDTSERIFTVTFLKDLYNEGKIEEKSDKSPNESLYKPENDSLLTSFMKSSSRLESKKKESGKDDLQYLVDNFISKDSQSLIDISGAVKNMEKAPRDLIISSRQVHVRAKSETQNTAFFPCPNKNTQNNDLYNADMAKIFNSRPSEGALKLNHEIKAPLKSPERMEISKVPFTKEIFSTQSKLLPHSREQLNQKKTFF